MHPVRVLFDLVPQLLVERRPLSWPGGAADRLSLDHRSARRGHGRNGWTSLKTLPALPLPYDHELHQYLPQGMNNQAIASIKHMMVDLIRLDPGRAPWRTHDNDAAVAAGISLQRGIISPVGEAHPAVPENDR